MAGPIPTGSRPSRRDRPRSGCGRRVGRPRASRVERDSADPARGGRARVRLRRVCDEIGARLDPDPWDPLPRHTQNSGASIAVTVAAYRRAGGIPAAILGEDRAFFAALRRIDARIRHSPACHAVVSGRAEGRAAGGMAETIRRRLRTPDLLLDERLEPAADCTRRAHLRRLFSRLLQRADFVIRRSGVVPRAG